MNVNVINLDRRVDRWAVVREQLFDLGFTVTRFPAIESKPGWKGCRDSHLELLEKHKDQKYNVIFEDDIEFLWVKPLPMIMKAMDELPPKWDALFLGASPQEPFKKYSPHLYKMGKAWCTHAIIWHNRKGGAVEYILDHRDEIGKFDVFLSEQVYPKFECYITFPMLATQKQTQSDCCTMSDLSTLVTNYDKYVI